MLFSEFITACFWIFNLPTLLLPLDTICCLFILYILGSNSNNSITVIHFVFCFSYKLSFRESAVDFFSTNVLILVLCYFDLIFLNLFELSLFNYLVRSLLVSSDKREQIQKFVKSYM